MSTEQVKAIARNHYDNTRDLEAAFKLVSRQVSFHALPGMPPKAYRWIGEMEEIAATFAAAGLPDGYVAPRAAR